MPTMTRLAHEARLGACYMWLDYGLEVTCDLVFIGWIQLRHWAELDFTSSLCYLTEPIPQDLGFVRSSNTKQTYQSKVEWYVKPKIQNLLFHKRFTSNRVDDEPRSPPVEPPRSHRSDRCCWPGQTAVLPSVKPSPCLRLDRQDSR